MDLPSYIFPFQSKHIEEVEKEFVGVLKDPMRSNWVEMNGASKLAQKYHWILSVQCNGHVGRFLQAIPRNTIVQFPVECSHSVEAMLYEGIDDAAPMWHHLYVFGGHDFAVAVVEQLEKITGCAYQPMAFTTVPLPPDIQQRLRSLRTHTTDNSTATASMESVEKHDGQRKVVEKRQTVALSCTASESPCTVHSSSLFSISEKSDHTSTQKSPVTKHSVTDTVAADATIIALVKPDTPGKSKQTKGTDKRVEPLQSVVANDCESRTLTVMTPTASDEAQVNNSSNEHGDHDRNEREEGEIMEKSNLKVVSFFFFFFFF
ncbi:hypothetical protein RFI_28224 [Reticulomyxa filosa]|uniref:Uncharacterized protein n=1 Tax=Reticulomyxa filosa TaxID=46433 RepID=X6M690_RETFI|nr:hypothetical protein RFI_28224 [Reticulomyxa filosa]|eukprot:ETO09161.1 hypothetical protein RFI_28224 [Reticulomyxa filosa]